MKSVINLVKELGVKSTAEVLELLRQVGVDTGAEGFGVMSKVDDGTVAKLHDLRKGNGAAPKARPATRRKAVEEPVNFDLSKGGLAATKSAGKDFFGVRAKPEKAVEEQKSTKKAVVPAPPRAKPAEAQARAQQHKPGARPDLSSGPKIISRPCMVTSWL